VLRALATSSETVAEISTRPSVRSTAIWRSKASKTRQLHRLIARVILIGFMRTNVKVLVGSTLAVAALLAAWAPQATASNGSLYPVLKQDILINADYWEKRPRMLAAGLGFVNILGVPDADSSDLALAESAVRSVGGAWNSGLTCPLTLTPPQRALTSAQSPVQMGLTFTTETLYGAGLPVEFSWPVRPSTVDPTDFRVTLNDGSTVTPDATSLTPNFEYNERSTVVLVGQFGNALPQSDPASRFVTKVEVVEDETPMQLVGPSGFASAIGMSATKDTSPYDDQPADPRGWTGPQLTAGKISRMSVRGEQAPVGLRAALPNHGRALYGKSAKFRVRVLTTGGFSPDGVRGIYPTDYRKHFQLRARARNGKLVKLMRPGRTYRIDGHPLRVVGLADVGQGAGRYDYCYNEDHDNQFDIILSGSIRAARRVHSVYIPAKGNGYRPLYNPGGPGLTPVPGVRYTAPGPRHVQRITKALKDPMTVTLRHGSPGPVAAPANLGFTTQALGTLSSAQTATVTNSPVGYPLLVNRVRTTGADRADFIVVVDDCTGESVPSSGSCEVSVRFAPTAAGVRSATLEIQHNGDSSPLSVPLSGTGGGGGQQLGALLQDHKANHQGSVKPPDQGREGQVPRRRLPHP